MPTTQQNAESNHDFFSSEKLNLSQQKTRNLIQILSKEIGVGDSKEIIKEKLESAFQAEGFTKRWHPTKIRIGSDTTKSFRDQSDPNLILKNNDIFFLDVGFVYDDHESDYGQTFALGDNQEHHALKDASESLFKEIKLIHQNENFSGKKLYQIAAQKAKSLGHKLNTQMGGHRLGSFPHGVFHKGQLINLEDLPSRKKWILEIHLINTKLNRGAFFEDLI